MQNTVPAPFAFFQKEKENPVLLVLEVIILLMTMIAIPVLCLKPMSGEPNLMTLLIHKIIPSILILHIALSAVWDARYGLTIPYFFIIGLSLFSVSCVAQAVEVTGPTMFLGHYVGEVWLGRTLCILQAFIALFFCVLFCFLTGFLEDKFKRPLCGAGDIKCIITFFFFPIPLDFICRSVIFGLALLLAASLYVCWRQGSRVPVRGLSWLYIGTIPALLYYY